MLQAGGATVLTSSTLPPSTNATVVVVPSGADETHELVRAARLRGIPCVTPDWVLDLLTKRFPGAVSAYTL